MKKFCIDKVIVEVCAGSLDDCLIAQKCGAQRIELNSALHLGGLTPSVAVLRLAKKQVTIPIICMVRPRGGGFCYSDLDIAVMFEEAKMLLENGADGIAFGFLLEDHTIDVALTKKMIDLIHSYQKVAVFHRAFDVVINQQEAIELLISMQCNRILTSGGATSALLGNDALKYMQSRYGDKIEFIMGSHINENNIVHLIQETGIMQCHGSFKMKKMDITSQGKFVNFDYSDKNCYEMTNCEQLKEVIKNFNNKSC